MLYAFVDANIFVRTISQGRPGCELSHFDDLRTLTEGGVIRLLVPEVLLLELEKQFHLLPRQFESQCDKLTNSITKVTEDLWNEIDALKVGILQQVTSYKKAKMDECERISSRISGFLRSTFVQNIPLTSDIWLNAQRRLIAGRLPHAKNSSSQDATLIESLVAFFRETRADQPRLLFCSENVRDFAVEASVTGKEKIFALYPQIQNDLPQATYFVNLGEMLALARGYESLPKLDEEQVRLAANMRDLNDVEEDDYGNWFSMLQEVTGKKLAEQFTTEVLSSLPADVNKARATLSAEIDGLLRRCRACSTWNDRSEDKLSQWIEYVPEQMVPYTSLSKMVRIKNSLEEYLRRHLGILPSDE